MKREHYWKIAIAVIGWLSLTYYALKPTYEIQVFKLGFYPYVEVTQMIYSSFMRRDLLYIYGNYQAEAYPERDYIILDNFSGFDSISQVIADCDLNRNVVIYSTSGPKAYKNPTNSKKIISRKVANGTYITMREKQLCRYIVAE